MKLTNEDMKMQTKKHMVLIDASFHSTWEWNPRAYIGVHDAHHRNKANSNREITVPLLSLKTKFDHSILHPSYEVGKDLLVLLHPPYLPHQSKKRCGP
jgi:hypothetical protein